MQPLGQPARARPWLIWSAAALLLLGLVMVFSASIATAEGSRMFGHQPAYFLVRHAVFLAIGVIAGLVAFQLPMRAWQEMAPWLFIGGVVLLLIVLIPASGVTSTVLAAGCRSAVNLQPSELMKLFAALYAADYTVRKLPLMGSFKQGFAPMAAVILFVGFLLLKEPDFGAFVVITAIAFGVLFLGGINVRLFVLLAVVATIGFVLLITFSEYRRQRILGFMDPWQDAYGKGYQLSHALIAFGRGEWFGVGLGGSIEKLFYLPEAHTDFLLAVIAEELGFAGVVTVVVLFANPDPACLCHRQAGDDARAHFAALVAQGIGIWMGVQSFINMGVNMGLLPTKGLTLPLMSFWRFGNSRQLRRARDPAADRLGEQPAHAGGRA
jgi:cell division protein FtsW